jgi:hypothetical protein
MAYQVYDMFMSGYIVLYKCFSITSENATYSTFPLCKNSFNSPIILYVLHHDLYIRKKIYSNFNNT